MSKLNIETFEAEHGADLKKYIRSKMLGEFEEQDHEDVWQEMIVRLIERDQRTDLPPIENPKEYGFITLRSVVAEYIKQRLQEQEMMVHLDEEWQEELITESIWTPPVSDPETLAIFNEAVENLSIGAAQAYEAYEMGLSVQEQADNYGTSKRTAERNRLRLREELREAGVSP